jgi:hypothetical protein
MKFWKRYKAKKELKQKLEKARFINFYGVFNIDFGIGEVKRVMKLDVTDDDNIFYNPHLSPQHYIVIEYKNFVEKDFKICVYDPSKRDRYYKELLDFLNSEKYIERLNYYNQLKYGQDVSKLKLASKKDTETNEDNIINLNDYR